MQFDDGANKLTRPRLLVTGAGAAELPYRTAFQGQVTPPETWTHGSARQRQRQQWFHQACPSGDMTRYGAFR